MRERLQARPEADDVAEPVDGRAERAEQMPRLHEQAFEHVDRVECLREMTPPAAVRTERLALLDRPKRSDEAERHGDRPGQREAERRGVSVCKKLDGDDARGRREQRVFERT